MITITPPRKMTKLLLFILLMLTTAISNATDLAGLLSGITGQPIFKKSDLYTTDDDVVITAYDNIKLQANIFQPSTGEAHYPAIIFINSWGMNEYEYLTEAAVFAEKGYIVLSYETRGFGHSEGKISTAGPEDIDDVSAVIDYLEANTNVDSERIGIAGISYGSGISLLSAANESRIAAVAAMSTWGSLTESLYGQQTPRLIWGGLLTGLGYLTGNPSDEIAQNYLGLLKQEGIDEITEWADIRSPLTYVEQLNQRQVPIYISNNFGDNLFQVNSVLSLFNALSVPKHLDLNQGTHAIAEVLAMGNADHHVWSNVHDWFDYWLKDIDNGIIDKPQVEMEVKFADYDTFENWPSTNISDNTWYLHEKELDGDGDIKTSPYNPWWPKTDRFYGSLDTFATSGIPILSYITEDFIDLPIISNMNFISTIHAIRWESDWLTEKTSLRGIPKIHINLTPSASDVMLVAYLYDVDFTGTARLITHAPNTLVDASAHTKIAIDIELGATAYDVPAGHYISLVIDTVDLLYSQPSSSFYHIDINYQGDQQNTLTLPIKD